MACAVVLILILTVVNADMVIKPVSELAGSKSDFSQMIEQISSNYTSNKFWGKNSFVNLNGLFGRITARRFVNNVYRLNNGTLSFSYEAEEKVQSMEAPAARIAALSDLVESQGMQFIFLLRPNKMDVNAEIVPVGLHNHMNENDLNLLSLLAQSGVKTFDFRDALMGDVDKVSRYFYLTDHHWNSDGALEAFRLLMDHLQTLDPSIHPTYTDPSMWERHSKDNWFLGSQGKRVGTLYAGVEPLNWHTPKFETHMTTINAHQNQVYRGDFYAANIIERYITQRNLFNDSAYGVYTGGDFSLVQHRNAQAPNRKRILLIKDSYMRPLEAFLSTEFTELDAIDPRYYQESSIADYCRYNHYDYVLLMSSSWNVGTGLYSEFGVNQAAAAGKITGWTTILENYDLEMPANERMNHFEILPVTLEQGKVYRVSFDDARLLEGTTNGFTIAVYREKDKEILYKHGYDIEYSHESGGEPYTFKIPENSGNCLLLVYSGMYAFTSWNGLSVSGLKVSVME